ncbi:hypothetical protein EYF80_035873 [Liparis tanakae]|uniref:Uncharacterized protein n=1 Tax=Liparis tanakae TaxID=230148 RepID=A0A4Z2GKB5_9TELE|nr:hypothetical protein EYF80_035873 [Liparis tanakae]
MKPESHGKTGKQGGTCSTPGPRPRLSCDRDPATLSLQAGHRVPTLRRRAMAGGRSTEVGGQRTRHEASRKRPGQWGRRHKEGGGANGKEARSRPGAGFRKQGQGVLADRRLETGNWCLLDRQLGTKS